MRNYYLVLLLLITNLFSYAQQTLIKDSLKSEVLGQTRHLNLVIPDTVGMQPGKKLNVVYVLDGDNAFVNLVASQISFVTDMESDKGVPAYLVVGIESENTRMDDFIAKGEYRVTGRADLFLDFMSNELFPYIEAHYNLNNHRVCVGHSLGGSLCMHVLCNRDSMFNAYMLFSPNLIYEKHQLIRDFKTKNPDSLHKFVFIANGDAGELEQNYLKGVEELDSLITNSPQIDNFKIIFEYMSDVNHSESVPVSFGKAVKEYLGYSDGTPKEEERTALLSEEDYAIAVKKIYDNRRLYLGYQFYPEVYPLYNDWITVAGKNEQPDKVIQLAKWAISIYQNDFSHYIMYLAMSEAYMDKDDVKTALKACDDARRAVNLLRETVDPQTYEYALEEINTLVDEIKQAEKQL
nr:alpha/beta hydrolase-fold protein [Bacteroides intestinalis]